MGQSRTAGIIFLVHIPRGRFSAGADLFINLKNFKIMAFKNEATEQMTPEQKDRYYEKLIYDTLQNKPFDNQEMAEMVLPEVEQQVALLLVRGIDRQTAIDIVFSFSLEAYERAKDFIDAGQKDGAFCMTFEVTVEAISQLSQVKACKALADADGFTLKQI